MKDKTKIIILDCLFILFIAVALAGVWSSDNYRIFFLFGMAGLLMVWRVRASIPVNKEKP